MADVGERIGQQLGNYRLLNLLGRGAFAEVYLGEHIHLGTHAAIKVLDARVDQDGITAFRAEARTIASLEHPSIVRVLDFGVDGNTPFLVMEYAPGGTLRTRFPRGTRLPLASVVSYVQQIASALQYAHDRRLVHRDIKPENLLVGRNNEVLLSDFGIALMAQSSRYLHPQDVAGTIAYMAPEQIQSYPRPASDQYSLGIVVYEWLGGEVPFKGAFTDVAVKHALVPPSSLLEKIPSLSPYVEQVVFTALAKDPQQRFPTVRDFASALKQACEATQQISKSVPMSDSMQYQSWQSTFVKTPSEHALQPALLNTSPAAPIPSPYISPATPIPNTYSSPATPMPNLTALQTTPIPDTNLPSFSGYTPTLEAFTSSVSTRKSDAPKSFMRSTRFKVILITVVCLVLIAGFAGALLRLTGSTSNQVQTAKLVVDHSILDFGKIEKSAKASIALGLSNTGESALNWTADVGKSSWLLVQTSSGTIEPGNKTLVNLTITTAALPFGESSTSLTITSNGGNVQVPVRVHVFNGPKEAILAVSTTALNFGTIAVSAQAAPLSVIVSNEGVLALQWSAKLQNGNWLTFNPSSGTILSGGLPQKINVQVDAGLATGSYSATMTITSNGGKPESVQMNMTVGNAPGPQPSPSPTSPSTPQAAQMSLNHTSLNFGSVPQQSQSPNMPLVLQNTGGEPLTWNATPGATWVKLDMNNGTINPTMSQPINVIVNTSGLAPGPQSATLSITSNVGSQQVTISVIVGPLWIGSTNSPSANSIYSSAYVASGVVYAGSADYHLYAWNAATGATLWSFPTGGPIYSSPTVVNGVVYVGSNDSNLYAVSTGGNLLWSFKAGMKIDSSPNVVSGVVYFGSEDGKLYAVNISTKTAWTFPTGGAIKSTPFVDNGMIYFGSDDHKVYAVNTSGQPVWSYLTGGSITSSATVAGGMVYIGSQDGKLYAFKEAGCGQPTCLPLWTASTGAAIEGSPAVVNGVVYSGSDDHKLYAWNASTGAFLWSYTTGDVIHSSPVVSGNVVYIGSNDKKVYAVNTNGTLRWTYQTGNYVGAIPTVPFNGNVVYIGSGDGKMYAFTAS
jgi:outer membrane protein assembly factor BamB/serine/threonine protein kinase